MIKLHQFYYKSSIYNCWLYICIVYYKRISTPLCFYTWNGKHTPIPKVISLIVISRGQQAS